MHLVLVSTFPPAECGIGNYTHELRQALASVAPEIDVSVLAERVPDRSFDDAAVTRLWDRRGNWQEALCAALRRSRPDIVHIQHEESHFGQDRRFVELLGYARSLRARTVVTLHTVHDHVLARAFHRRLAAVCDAIVAHQDVGMARVLAAHGVPRERIVVIPHGTPALALPDRGAARRALGLPDNAPTALFFGFIHPRKNVHVAVRAFENVAVDLPQARLVIAGRMRRSGLLDERYAKYLWMQMRRGIEAGRIIYRPGFIPTDQKPIYFAATDVLLLPHRQTYGSASGVLHEGLAARRAILCSRGKKFAEAVAYLAERMPFAVPQAHDVVAWEIGLERLLGSYVDRERVVQLVAHLADVTSWQASAARHADLYRTVCGGITKGPQVG